MQLLFVPQKFLIDKNLASKENYNLFDFVATFTYIIYAPNLLSNLLSILTNIVGFSSGLNVKHFCNQKNLQGELLHRKQTFLLQSSNIVSEKHFFAAIEFCKQALIFCYLSYSMVAPFLLFLLSSFCPLQTILQRRNTPLCRAYQCLRGCIEIIRFIISYIVKDVVYESTANRKLCHF